MLDYFNAEVINELIFQPLVVDRNPKMTVPLKINQKRATSNISEKIVSKNSVLDCLYVT